MALKTKGSFIQNFSYVFGGKSIIFVIGFCFTPVIARFYTPEAYGAYALYSAVVLNLTIMVLMQIHTAFVIINHESRFRLIFRNLIDL